MNLSYKQMQILKEQHLSYQNCRPTHRTNFGQTGQKGKVVSI